VLLTFRDLLEKLGIESQMEGYQTQPWHVIDTATTNSCSAEVRIMDGECSEVEAEIITEKAETLPNEPRIKIVLWLQAHLEATGKYRITKCRFEGQDFVNSVSSWEEKAMKFFKTSVREMKKDVFPDFDAIKEDVMRDKGGAGQGGRGGGRAPKIKPNQLLNDMKNTGRGF
jgi:hypothetical protein